MLAGCAQEPEDIKTVISILYFNECGNLEKLVEDTYSDIDLQFERLSYPSEQMRRLEKGMAPMLIGMLFLGSVQLFFIGFLGEYIMSINQRVMKRPLVIEEERINFNEEEKKGGNEA